MERINNSNYDLSRYYLSNPNSEDSGNGIEEAFEEENEESSESSFHAGVFYQNLDDVHNPDLKKQVEPAPVSMKLVIARKSQALAETRVIPENSDEIYNQPNNTPIPNDEETESTEDSLDPRAFDIEAYSEKNTEEASEESSESSSSESDSSASVLSAFDDLDRAVI